MNNFVILTDNTADLNKELRTKYNIEVINCHFMNEQGKDLVSFNDFTDTDLYENGNAFYKALKQEPTKFTTAPFSIPELVAKLEEYVKEDKEVLCFAITSKMSGTFNFFNQAKDQVLVNYPDAKIYVVDSLHVGAGIGLMCINASILRDKGMSCEEVYNYSEEHKFNYHQMGWLDDLSFVAKKGRITQAKAFFGTLINIKPMGENDQNGLITVIGKAKGEKQAYAVMSEYIKNTIVNPEENVILVCHTAREKQAKAYIELLKTMLNPKDIYLIESGPSMGINVGPGLMAAYYFGKELSNELTNEKGLMEELLNK